MKRKALAMAALLLFPSPSPAADAVQKVGPRLYRLNGRGILNVPPGWKLTQRIGDRLMFENGATPYADSCLVSPGVFAEDGTRKTEDSMAALLIEDYTDDFSKKTADRPEHKMRRWSQPYRGMTAARFVGSARESGAFAFRDGRKIDGYASFNVIEIAKAGVALSVRCIGLYRTVNENVGADMIDAVDIDASRPRVFNH